LSLFPYSKVSNGDLEHTVSAAIQQSPERLLERCHARVQRRLGTDKLAHAVPLMDAIERQSAKC
jgi:hypothetical protein